MKKVNPYEYHNNTLGVQGRFIFSGDNAHEESLCLISYKGLASRISRGSTIRLRVTAENSPMLVSFDSLPYKWQEAIVRVWGDAPKLMQQTMFEKHFVRDYAAFDFFCYHRFDDGTTIERYRIDEYTLNASVLNTIEKVYAERAALQRSLRKGRVRSDIWQSITNECTLFKQDIPHTLPENERRLREKYNQYRKESYKCLIHKGRLNSNALKVDDDHITLLNNMFAGIEHKPTYAEVAKTYEGFLSGYVEVINNETGEVYDPKSFSSLSVATVWNHLSKWENKIGNELARSGDRQKYMAKFKPYHRLLQPQFAGSLISIDDRQPVFEYSNGKRMWFYNGIDLGSEAFTCWVYGQSKEGIIIDFYRQMVRNYAEWNLPLPAELEGEMSLNSSFTDTFLKEGNMFQYVRIEANNARGKRIEAYYRQLRYQYEKKREGWLARPFAISEANQARTEKKQIIPYETIVEGCLRDIETWNNSEHSKIKGMSRWDVFMSMQNPNVRPTNYHGILPYLGYKKTSSVHAGIMNFRSSKFLLGLDGVICTGESLIKLMQLVEGCDVDIYWLDGNDGEVLKAYMYINDQFICEAIEHPGYGRARIERTKEDMINRELVSKYVNTIDSYGRRSKNELDKVTIIDNIPVTVGNSFKMPGLQPKYTATNEPARVLASVSVENNQQLNTNSKSFNRSTIDRW